jgi:ADP-dependent NAD(P)H-hydrate dehydratase / NAD(P)H-hydrate epimerase
MDSLSKVLRRPTAVDDKYSRGVVGFVTGSMQYPGAAILGVTAAMRTGVGMVRYLGPESVGKMLLEVRPEAVLQPGRSQAWVVGSGIAADETGEQATRLLGVLEDAQYAVIDAGALDIVDFESLKATAILTPHAGELERLLARLGSPMTRPLIEANPEEAAILAATLTGQTVLLKGNVTTIASPDKTVMQTPPANPALATAGSGDVLAGILGALVAANSAELTSGHLTLGEIALAGALLHAQAADLAAMDGPVAALDVAEAVRKVVGDILA